MFSRVSKRRPRHSHQYQHMFYLVPICRRRYMGLGKLAAAQPLLEQAELERRKKHGAQSAPALNSLCNLAALHDNKGDRAAERFRKDRSKAEALWGEAVTKYKEVWRGRRRTFGEARRAPSPFPYFVPGVPHVMLIELRKAPVSYQDYHMLLLTLGRRSRPPTAPPPPETSASPTKSLPSAGCSATSKRSAGILHG